MEIMQFGDVNRIFKLVFRFLKNRLNVSGRFEHLLVIVFPWKESLNNEFVGWVCSLCRNFGTETHVVY